MFRQKFRIQQCFRDFFIAIITAAIADVFHVATLKNALDYKIGLGVVIDIFKNNIPKNPY